jgi:hypothetical protein
MKYPYLIYFEEQTLDALSTRELEALMDEAQAHSIRNSTATSGLPSTHASRSREPPSF